MQQRRLRLLAWETTRACRFACSHCRASACADREPDELTTDEGKALLASAATVGPGIVILSGGEPLLRPDLEELIEFGTRQTHTMVIACNDAEKLTDERIASLKAAGCKRFSFSLHSHQAGPQDSFLGKPGAFNDAILAFGRLMNAGIPFQINTTVLPANFLFLPDMLAFVESLKAVAWHLFFVVNTGRATESADNLHLDEITTEKVLQWVASVVAQPGRVPIKVTCAPQYSRILAQRGITLPQHGRSCMAGDGFAFVSRTGEVKPCGYFDRIAGSVRETPFAEIYADSPLFADLRNTELLDGNCGICKFRNICGGCRARAYSQAGNHLATDPTCSFDPSSHYTTAPSSSPRKE
jgi:radical SAM protein with 4Fe4S-binding SPASM domain